MTPTPPPPVAPRPAPTPADAAVVTVASAPRRHVYTRHLRHPSVPVRHVATPDEGYRAVQVIDPGWVDAHADRIDVVHTHFGFGDVPLRQMRAWRAALRRHGIPLVHTVHDIDNPHVADQTGHHRRRDLLLGSADALVTLTDAAADRVHALCGRRPAVLPHPHVVDLGHLGALHRRWSPARPPTAVTTVGLHCKDHRVGIDALPFLHALLDVTADRPDVVVRVDVHPELRRDHPCAYGGIRAAARHPRVHLHHTTYLPDLLLWRYLAGLDLAVLPYRLGTHSGWVEACVDVGTPVAVPSWMPAATQHPPPRVLPLAVGPDGPDRGQLADVLDRVRHGRRTAPAAARWRAAQRLAIATAHHHLYTRLRDRGRVAAA